MRSSNYKHMSAETNFRHAKRENADKKKLHRAVKFGSVIAALVICAGIFIPNITFVQNVEAATNEKMSVFSVGGASDFSDAISGYDKEQAEKDALEAKKAEEKKKAEAKRKAEKKAAEEAAAMAETEPETEAEDESYDEVYVEKNYGLLSIANTDTSYVAEHIELSDYDRDLVERVVMGEAGSLGYTGAALVAQAVRDSMIMSGTTSADYIISSYQYDGATYIEPSADVKSAVSFIFDSDGYAVQHRILYFYASDIVDDAWHESQEFIVSYGNVRFFDMW